MARTKQTARQGAGGEKKKEKLAQNFKRKNKQPKKKKNQQQQEVHPAMVSEFNGRPQQGSFPDKKRTLISQRFQRKAQKKNFGGGKKLSYGKDNEENMAKHLQNATSKNWVNREIDENQSFASSSSEDDSDVADDEDQVSPEPKKPQTPKSSVNSKSPASMSKKAPFEVKAEKNSKRSSNSESKKTPAKSSESKKSPFETFDELMEARKAKQDLVETSEDEDMVPMVNTSKRTPPSFNAVKSNAFDSDETDDDVEMDSDEEDGDDGDLKNDSEDDADVAAGFRKKVAEMSMAQVKALQNKIGIKLFNKMMEENEPEVEAEEAEKVQSEEESSDDEDAPEEESSSKKKSRHAPREMSSKVPVSFHRTIDPNAVNHAKKKFDPRFSERAGSFHEGEFRKDYGFLDDLRKNDIQKFNAALKDAKTKKEKEKVKEMIRSLKNQQSALEERDLWRETKNELLADNIDRMNQGLKPVFVNNKQMKQIFKDKKLKKIEETQGKKGLDKYNKKKERRESKKKLV